MVIFQFKLRFDFPTNQNIIIAFNRIITVINIYVIILANRLTIIKNSLKWKKDDEG